MSAPADKKAAKHSNLDGGSREKPWLFLLILLMIGVAKLQHMQYNKQEK